jgi:hypothetical protein
MVNLDINYLKKFEPYYFGLGFIQLKLNDSERLHFYHPDILPILDEEDIHDHRYDFTSKILLGSLEQDIFTYRYNPHEYSHKYGLFTVSCKREDAGTPATYLYGVDPVYLTTYKTSAGQSYNITKEAFHRVRIKEPTLTYLNRKSPVKEVALVIKKLDAPDVCPFSKKLSDDELWGVIEDIIERITCP